MSKNVVTVWWYERGTGELRSQSFSPGTITRGSTYEHEVDVKYARDAVRMVTTYPGSGGLEALEALTKEAANHRQSIAKSP